MGERGPVGVYGMGQQGWVFTQQKGLMNRARDINWLALHRRLPVREVLNRHGLTRGSLCPREGCGAEETLEHVFWECGFATKVWREFVLFFCHGLGF